MPRFVFFVLAFGCLLLAQNSWSLDAEAEVEHRVAKRGVLNYFENLIDPGVEPSLSKRGVLRVILNPNELIRRDDFLSPTALIGTAKNKMVPTVPGTKWCGLGNVALRNESYGRHSLTDQCCKVHDECSDLLLAGESKYGLQNTAKYTRLHCSCDEVFYKCLKNVHSIPSYIVGKIYFNVLKNPCYKEDHPIVGCVIRSKSGRCKEYVLDFDQPKKYQWFDNRKF